MTRFVLAGLIVTWGAFLARAEAPAIARLEAFPPEVRLTTAGDRQSLVVQATFADGLTRDVTKDAALTLANPAFVRREGAMFFPVADGSTTLTVAFGGQSLSIPVEVKQAKA